MMDLETIKYLNSKAGSKAKKDHKEPLTFTTEIMNVLCLDNIEPIRTIPDLGNHEPKGWKRFDLGKIKDQFRYSHKIYNDDNSGYGAFFVDQGFGSEDEPAMTIGQFIHSINQLWNNSNVSNNKKLGYGIVEAGQFQVKIGVFQPA